MHSNTRLRCFSESSNHQPICMARCGTGVGVRTYVVWSASPPARNRDIHYLALQTITLSGFSVLFFIPALGSQHGFCSAALIRL